MFQKIPFRHLVSREPTIPLDSFPDKSRPLLQPPPAAIFRLSCRTVRRPGREVAEYSIEPHYESKSVKILSTIDRNWNNFFKILSSCLGQLEDNVEHAVAGLNYVLQPDHARVVDGLQKLNLDGRGEEIVDSIQCRGRKYCIFCQ